MIERILAGGSYNGELCLWDTNTNTSLLNGQNNKEPQIAISTLDDYFHREAIQSVQWVYIYICVRSYG